MVSKRIYNLAQRISQKSDHPRYQFGCILFDKKEIISIGYNQLKTHPKSPHEWKYVHAEFHAILGVPVSKLKGASLFIYMEKEGSGNVGTAKPCKACCDMLKNAGIKQIYYTSTYDGIKYEAY